MNLKPWARAKLAIELKLHLDHLTEAAYTITDKAAESIHERREFLALIIDELRK